TSTPGSNPGGASNSKRQITKRSKNGRDKRTALQAISTIVARPRSGRQRRLASSSVVLTTPLSMTVVVIPIVVVASQFDLPAYLAPRTAGRVDVRVSGARSKRAHELGEFGRSDPLGGRADDIRRHDVSFHSSAQPRRIHSP